MPQPENKSGPRYRADPYFFPHARVKDGRPRSRMALQACRHVGQHTIQLRVGQHFKVSQPGPSNSQVRSPWALLPGVQHATLKQPHL